MALLKGKPIAEEIKIQLREEIADRQDKPRLAIVVVGENPVSKKFVELKEKFASEIGAETRRYELPADISTSELRERMNNIVHESKNDGVIVQLPLPEHIDVQGVLNAVVPEKDVDMLSARAVGDFQVGRAKIFPPVVGGIKALFDRQGIEIRGKRVVVVGYGRLVGQPISVWAKREGAVVTVITDAGQNDPEIIKSADIVISGAGVPHLIRGEHIKEGAVVVDVGSSEQHGKTVGDVETDSVRHVASYLAPVPGGVGPLTVVFVFQNLIALARKK